MEAFDYSIDDQPEQSRQATEPPHDYDAERSVLAHLIGNNAKLDEMDVPLHGEDFYSERHKLIFNHIILLAAKQGTAADSVTVATSLKDAGCLDRSGGKNYLIELTEYADIAQNFKEYVQIVRDKSTLRKLKFATDKIRETIHQPGDRSCGTVLDDAEGRVFKISSDYNNRRHDSAQLIKEFNQPISDQIDKLYELAKSGLEPITGLRTKFKLLDLMTSGLQPSDLIILAARPSVGKTAFALDVIRHICKGTKNEERNEAVALFSMEMSSEQITKRILSMEAGVDQHQLRTGQIKRSEDWSRFMAAQGEIEKWPFWIDDTPMLNVLDLRSRARRIQREAQNIGKELKLIVVDYLQLMDSDQPNRNENRATEVSQISRALKALAREMKLPVLALSQLSRKTEERRTNRPQLSDLRESGAIEQDADVIMFLSRVAKPDEPMITKPRFEEIELIIGKHRNGPTGMVKLEFDRSCTHFKETTQQGYDSNDPPSSRTDEGDHDDYTFNS